MLFCLLIPFGLAIAQVTDVAANLTERGCMLCWWSTSFHNQVCVCWGGAIDCPVGAPSFSMHACVLFKVLLLFWISWMVRNCPPVCVFLLLGTFPPYSRPTVPSIIFKLVPETEKKNKINKKQMLLQLCRGKLGKYQFTLKLGLQLCMYCILQTTLSLRANILFRDIW